jgi:hypothetical protein
VRFNFSIPASAFVAGTLAILAGCSGGSQTALSSLPATGTAQSNRQIVSKRFLPNGLVASALVDAPSRVISQLAKGQSGKVGGHDLFVSTYPEVVALKNTSYKAAGTITSGISDPDGEWVDGKGNLYVANAAYESNTPDVVEYAKGASSPTCTYSSQLVDPINETTDSAGNVYVVDFNPSGSTGYIYKYPQCSNTVSATYTIDHDPEGVAVDAKGDLFVSYCGSTCGNFEEFKKGSTKAKELGAVVDSAGGLIIDQRETLYTVDQDQGRIDIIRPPYSQAEPVITGLSYPFHLALGENGKKLFVACPDSTTSSVYVYDFPSYKLDTSLGSADGFQYPLGVADSPDQKY